MEWKVRSQRFCPPLLVKNRNYEGIWSNKRKSFVKPVGMNGSNFKNETLFVSFTAIITTRNGWNSTNFYVENRVVSSIKMVVNGCKPGKFEFPIRTKYKIYRNRRALSKRQEDTSLSIRRKKVREKPNLFRDVVTIFQLAITDKSDERTDVGRSPGWNIGSTLAGSTLDVEQNMVLDTQNSTGTVLITYSIRTCTWLDP